MKKLTKIPTIKVGSRDLKVKIVESLDDKLGYLDWDNNIIRIVESSNMDSTLLHELLHALSFLYDLDLSESQVIRLESGLKMLYKDNPELKKIL